jgi:hypothetical protein
VHGGLPRAVVPPSPTDAADPRPPAGLPHPRNPVLDTVEACVSTLDAERPAPALRALLPLLEARPGWTGA